MGILQSEGEMMDGGTVGQAATSASNAAQSQAQPLPIQLWLMVVLALLVFYGVLLVRAMPWPESMLQKKPWNCDVCLSFWVALPLLFLTVWFFNTTFPWGLLHIAAAPAASVFLLRLHAKLTDFTPPE